MYRTILNIILILIISIFLIIKWSKYYYRDGFNYQIIKNNSCSELELTLTDKLRAKLHFEHRYPEMKVAKLYRIFLHPQHINLRGLPKKYIVKANYGSGTNIKSVKSTPSEIRKKISSLLQSRHQFSSEAHRLMCSAIGVYDKCDLKMLRSKLVFAEEFLDDLDYDFKFHVLNGKVLIIGVHKIFSPINQKITYYDKNWNKLKITRKFSIIPISTRPINIDKPPNLVQVIKLAEKIAIDHHLKYARVDLYVINNQIYFGEITLFPSDGICYFHPDELEFEMGKAYLSGDNTKVIDILLSLRY